MPPSACLVANTRPLDLTDSHQPLPLFQPAVRPLSPYLRCAGCCAIFSAQGHAIWKCSFIEYDPEGLMDVVACRVCRRIWDIGLTYGSWSEFYIDLAAAVRAECADWEDADELTEEWLDHMDKIQDWCGNHGCLSFKLPYLNGIWSSSDRDNLHCLLSDYLDFLGDEELVSDSDGLLNEYEYNRLIDRFPIVSEQ